MVNGHKKQNSKQIIIHKFLESVIHGHLMDIMCPNLLHTSLHSCYHLVVLDHAFSTPPLLPCLQVVFSQKEPVTLDNEPLKKT